MLLKRDSREAWIPHRVSNFLRAQIEANKCVQYALLAEWRRVEKAPDHKPVDLAGHGQ